MNGIMPYVVFCDCLLSLSVMFSRFIHVVAGYYSFLWPNNISGYGCGTFGLSIHWMMN